MIPAKKILIEQGRVIDPDTDPVLDEPGLVEMLKMRAERLHQSCVLPQGALTHGLKGEQLTEMLELTEAGCVAFGQADVPLLNTRVLQRALQYASTFGYALWLRPQDAWLDTGVAASGPLATTRMGLTGVPAVAETIALHTLLELMRTQQGSAGQGGGPRVRHRRPLARAARHPAQPQQAHPLCRPRHGRPRALHHRQRPRGF